MAQGNQNEATRSQSIGASQTRFYASLIGPLLGCYYPMPPDFNKAQCRAAMNSSRLKPLWMSIYPRNEVVEAIQKFGGLMLPDEFAARLDYDSEVVERWKGTGS